MILYSKFVVFAFGGFFVLFCVIFFFHILFWFLCVFSVIYGLRMLDLGGVFVKVCLVFSLMSLWVVKRGGEFESMVAFNVSIY
jgi:hypothetical protein